MRLSEFIVSDMKGILQEWDDFARSLPGAESMDRSLLRDHAEKILLTIVRDMEREQSTVEQIRRSKGQRDSTDRGANSAAQEHGSGRLEEGFSMPEMVAEYRALRASVVRRWRERQKLPDDALDQVTRFNEGIDQALAESVRRFSERLDRARELFMGALGHDLRAPLHVILSAATSLRKPETAQRRHSDMVGYVQDSAEHIQRMINDLLDVTQTKLGGALPINPRPTHAGEICNRVIAEMRALHHGRQFNLDSSGDLNGIWDVGRIEQLVSNLLSNAAQHGKSNTAVTVFAKGDEDKLVLSVHNEGEPIPERMQSRIFEPLVRGGDVEPASSVMPNMGLGLYIACTIVRAHRGSIGVQSSKETGTTFKVSLPKRPAKA